MSEIDYNERKRKFGGVCHKLDCKHADTHIENGEVLFELAQLDFPNMPKDQVFDYVFDQYQNTYHGKDADKSFDEPLNI